MNFWIMKSEPDEFSIDDLKTKKNARWDGVRNYQVRNMLRDIMKPKDLAFFYHSSCKDVGIAGILSITSAAYNDPTAEDKKSKYFDPFTLKKTNPWLAVDVKFEEKFDPIISRKDLTTNPKLKDLKIMQKGCRLSITSITKAEFEIIKKLNLVL